MFDVRRLMSDISHQTSVIRHETYISRLTSDIWNQMSDYRPLTSNNRCQQTLDIRHQKSSIWPLMSVVGCLIIDVWCDKCMIFYVRSQTSDFRHLMSEVRRLAYVWHQSSDLWHQTSNIYQPSDIRHLKSDVWLQTFDIKQQMSTNFRHKTSKV